MCTAHVGCPWEGLLQDEAVTCMQGDDFAQCPAQQLHCVRHDMYEKTSKQGADSPELSPTWDVVQGVVISSAEGRLSRNERLVEPNAVEVHIHIEPLPDQVVHNLQACPTLTGLS